MEQCHGAATGGAAERLIRKLARASLYNKSDFRYPNPSWSVLKTRTKYPSDRIVGTTPGNRVQARRVHVCPGTCTCAQVRARVMARTWVGDSRLGTRFKRVISWCDTHPPLQLPVIDIGTSCGGEEAEGGGAYLARPGCARTRYARIRKMGDVFQ